MRIMVISSDTKSLIDFRADLMMEMKNLGNDIIAVAPENGYDEEFNKMGIDFVQVEFDRASTSVLEDIKFYFKIKKIINEKKPDIVFSYALKPVIYASIAASKCGVEKIYSLLPGLGHAFNKGEVKFKDKVVSKLVRMLLKYACNLNKRIIVQNPDDRQELINEKIIKEDKVVRVNSSGVNMDRFKISDYPDNTTFIMISRLLKNKGVIEYISAAKNLKKKYKDVRFQLLGPIDSNPLSLSKNELDNLIDDDSVEYLGVTDDVRDYIGNASVFVLPSYYREGVPRSIQEAMAMGRTIITTDWIGCKETVVDGYNGYLVKPKEICDIEEKMEILIKDPELIQEMGKNSLEYCKEKFDINLVNKQMLEFIDLI